jgi:hypothetical protein
MFPIYYPWISEISLSVHRKYKRKINFCFFNKIFRTNILRRFLNYSKRSKKSTLSNLAEEFVRIHNGHFNYPIGFRVSKHFLLRKFQIFILFSFIYHMQKKNGFLF